MSISIEDRADDIVARLCPMYSREMMGDNGEPIPMYSYDRPTGVFWRIYVEALLENGATDAEVEWILQSKLMRRMFDNPTDELIWAIKCMALEDYIFEASDNL